MSMHWITREDVSVAAIVGICKNAGKTSLLNAILREYPDIGFGVLSTGIDGEETDTVFQTPKPRVHLPAGTMFCCDSRTLNSHGSAVEVLFSFSDGGSRDLWIARAVMPIATQITGPATASDQIRATSYLLGLGAQKVLVDGSLDRKSIALSDDVDAVAVVLGASFGPPAKVAEELARLLALAKVPIHLARPEERDLLDDADSVLAKATTGWNDTGISSLMDSDAGERLQALGKSAKALYIPGAITESVWKGLRSTILAMKAKVVLRHPDCLKLGLPALNSFLESVRPTALIPFRIVSFALNTGGPQAGSSGADAFRASLRKQFPHLELIDIMEVKDA